MNTSILVTMTIGSSAVHVGVWGIARSCTGASHFSFGSVDVHAFIVHVGTCTRTVAEVTVVAAGLIAVVVVAEVRQSHVVCASVVGGDTMS